MMSPEPRGGRVSVDKEKNRRKYLRLTIPLKVAYRRWEDAQQDHASQSVDLSAEGIRLSLPNQLKVGDRLELRLELPKAPNPVHILGEIVWVTESKEGGYDTGVRFQQFEEDNKNTFLKYFCELLYERLNR